MASPSALAPARPSRLGMAVAGLAVMATVVSALACPAPRARFAARAPANVLMVLVDTLRADRLGCYGATRPTSPNIDALARRSLVFENTMATAPWTVPAVASLFTATYPSTHGQTRVRGRHGRLSEDLVTLPEILRDRGWTTVAFSGHPWISPAFGFGQGFAAEDFHLVRMKENAAKDDPMVTAAFLEWLRRHGQHYRPSRGRQFFAYVHFMGPHNPYAPSEDAQRAVLGAVPSRPPAIDRLAGRTIDDGFKLLGKAAESGTLTREDVDYLRGQYDAEVFTVDTEIARVLHALRSEGLHENTLVVITADHGEAFLEHGRMVHMGSLYHEMLHVPLVIHLPGQRKPRRIVHRVQSVDVLPTVLDAMRLPRPPSVQGSSRWPDEDPGERPAFAEAMVIDRNRHVKLVNQGFGYIADLDAEWRDELYDLLADPREAVNVRAKHPEVAQAMRRQIIEFQRANQKKARALRAEPAPAPDAATLERLRALGYVQ